MKRSLLSIAVAMLLIIGCVGMAGATLIDNLDGTITQIRDDGSMLMWLQDFSLANQSSFVISPTDDRLTWNNAMSWAGQLDFAGYDDWRLPTAYNLDGSDPEYGFNITSNEWGSLYYLELDGTASPPDGTSHLGTDGPFINMQFDNANIWSSTVYAPEPRNRWGFGWGTGIHADVGYYGTINDAVAVRDITPVPEPSTMLLLGTGLIGLAGWGRRKLRKR